MNKIYIVNRLSRDIDLEILNVTDISDVTYDSKECLIEIYYKCRFDYYYHNLIINPIVDELHIEPMQD